MQVMVEICVDDFRWTVKKRDGAKTTDLSDLAGAFRCSPAACWRTAIKFV